MCCSYCNCNCVCVHDAWYVFVFVILLQIFFFSHFLNRSKITYRGWQHDSKALYFGMRESEFKKRVRYTEEKKQLGNIRFECFIFRIPLLCSMLLLIAVAAARFRAMSSFGDYICNAVLLSQACSFLLFHFISFRFGWWSCVR